MDKSLVVAEEREGAMRYRLLETIRQYGRERLCQAGDQDACRRRHRDWLLAMAEANGPRTWGAKQVAAFDRLELELDNLRAAVDWCEAEGAGNLGLRLGAALWRSWDIRGYIGEGRARLTRLPDLVGTAADPRSRARVLWEVGCLAIQAGDVDEAVACWRDSLTLGRATGDPIVVAAATGHLAHCEQLGGNGTEADAALAAALHEPHLAGDPTARLVLLYGRGYLAVQRGELALAEEMLGEGVAVGRASGDAFMLAHCLSTLGHAALLRGELDRARQHLAEALRLRQSLKSTTTLAFSVEKLGWVAAAAGRAREAARLLGAAAGLRARAGAELYPYEMEGHERALAAARRRLGGAASEAAWAAGRALGPEEAVDLGLSLDVDGPARATREPLTGRQAEIAALVARGLTNRQIAERLSIAERSVANHLQRIYVRLGLRGRAALASWAARDRD